MSVSFTEISEYQMTMDKPSIYVYVYKYNASFFFIFCFKNYRIHLLNNEICEFKAKYNFNLQVVSVDTLIVLLTVIRNYGGYRLLWLELRTFII